MKSNDSWIVMLNHGISLSTGMCQLQRANVSATSHMNDIDQTIMSIDDTVVNTAGGNKKCGKGWCRVESNLVLLEHEVLVDDFHGKVLSAIDFLYQSNLRRNLY
jgi:hypothetical protein